MITYGYTSSFIHFFIILLLPETSAAVTSFVYEKIGNTITVPLERAQVFGLESQILDILGIDDPLPPSETQRDKDDDVAQFMKTLYGSLDDRRLLKRNGLEKFADSDTVISFSPVSTSSFDQVTAIAFEISDFPPESRVQAAELRIKMLEKFGGRVVLYRKRNRELQEVSATLITQPAGSTVVFNITQEVENWIGGRAAELFVEFKGAPLRPRISPFGVVSFQEGSSRRRPMRRKRSSPPPTPPPQAMQTTAYVDPLRGDNPNLQTGCRRQGLYVNFNDLGWKEWVIAPEGFQAFMCDGACSFPLHSKMNATHHAIVQTLVHLVHPTRAPEPKCAPSRLGSLKIIFIDNSKNVVLKTYADMLVQECGCQ